MDPETKTEFDNLREKACKDGVEMLRWMGRTAGSGIDGMVEATRKHPDTAVYGIIGLVAGSLLGTPCLGAIGGGIYGCWKSKKRNDGSTGT